LDKLEYIFEKQKELAAFISSARYPKSREKRVSVLSTAIIHESVELQRLTNWKWWKKQIEFDEKGAREEIIDIWHFLVQASIELGMTPSNILDEYQKKNQINRQRKKDGY
jgi:dimeric dUTPase (all-alpha-NTP-PPase superfamily)